MVQAKLSKAADFRSLSLEDIAKQVEDGKRDLFDLRCKQKARQEMKTSDFTKTKLKIAQLLTVSREKEIASGEVDRRAWRRKQKKKNIAAGFPQF